MPMTIHDVEQGTPEWFECRRGILTASEMSLCLTPTLKLADNDKVRGHVWELLAQRISGFVEPGFQSFDMIRGHEDEVLAREAYAAAYAPVTTVGFITNDRWGFTLGFSPDGLVGKNGLIEAKSRKQKYQIQNIVENVGTDTIAAEFMLQAQTGLMVSERKWVDHISYSGGLPMSVIRVHPDDKVQEAILNAAQAFEARIVERRALYEATIARDDVRLIPTERREYSDGDDIVAEVEA